MSISINCQCGRKMLISEELEGLPVRCPNCGRKHLVPKDTPILTAKPIEPEKQFILVAKPVCQGCKQEIDIKANFCPNCGTPVRERPEKEVKPVRMAPPKKIEDQLPIKPEIFPGPFKGKRQNQPFEKDRRVYAYEPRFNHRHECCKNKRHQVRNIMNDAKLEKVEGKPEKKTSGLASFSFFASFLGLVITLLGVLVVSNKYAMMHQTVNHNMYIGMGLLKVAGVFSVLGGITAFFAIFHFNRKRFLLIFLSILFFIGTFGIVGHSMKCKRSFHRYHMQDIPRLELQELEELPGTGPAEDYPEEPESEDWPEAEDEDSFDEQPLKNFPEAQKNLEKFAKDLEKLFENKNKSGEENEEIPIPIEPRPENDVQENNTEDF